MRYPTNQCWRSTDFPPSAPRSSRASRVRPTASPFLPLTFGIDDSPHDPTPVRQLRLGEVDEWTVRSVNLVGPVHHPFHIHVNPFEVFSIMDENGNETLDAPVWRDTVILRSNRTVKFRTRYRRFTGRFVLHCRILDYEDLGMMEVVKINR